MYTRLMVGITDNTLHIKMNAFLTNEMWEMHVITAIIELEVNSGGSLTEKLKLFFLEPP